MNKKFSISELYRHDGDYYDSKYIAFQGIVYDITDCPKWRSQLHENQHFPGQDLTNELSEAPHSKEVFDHPCVKRIGVLVQG